MDETAYKDWWQLHLRHAQGETLSAEEQAAYQTGCAALDATETFPDSLEELRRARERAEELELTRARLQAEYDTLRAEIVALESHLSEPTRRLLGVSS